MCPGRVYRSMTRRKSGPVAKEGDIVAVPLPSHGWAVGVVARADGKGICFGYFFGPRLNEIPDPNSLGSLDSDAADYVHMFGDLGILKNKWSIIGRVEPWDRNQWPMALFHAGGSIVVRYDEYSLEEVGRMKVSSQECDGLPVDGLGGSGFIEDKLDILLP